MLALDSHVRQQRYKIACLLEEEFCTPKLGLCKHKTYDVAFYYEYFILFYSDFKEKLYLILNKKIK